jgi:predicted MFS family arabinose efflux permease
MRAGLTSHRRSDEPGEVTPPRYGGRVSVTRSTPRRAVPATGISGARVLLFAAACGLAAANLYYAQPVLHTIAGHFDVTSGTAGLVVTFGQIGYAAGLGLLVPVGDFLNRRRLVPFLLVVTAAGLAASAASPDIGVLIALALLVGAGSVVAQLLVPMAASLADDAHRGRVVGTVMSGLLLGILLARTVSGLIAGISSWRVVYLVAAILILLMAAVLSRGLPPEGERPRMNYGSLLKTAAGILVSEPLLRRRAGYGALSFAVFSIFWTTIAFLLAGPPYHYGDTIIGLFGLVGAAGAVCANFAGRWADRDLTRTTTLVFAAAIAVAFVPLWFGRQDLGLLILGIVVLDIGVQGMQVTNQSLIYRLRPDARSRVNSAYMVLYFTGGAIGSALGGAVYDSHRWAGVCVAGAAVGTVAVLGAVIGFAYPPSRPPGAGRVAATAGAAPGLPASEAGTAR